MLTPRQSLLVAASVSASLVGWSGAAAARRPAPSLAARSHVVRMVGDTKGFRFEPATVEIASGDTVVFEVVSGPPHDVAFDTAGVPSAVAGDLSRQVHDQIAPLAGPLLVKAGERYTVSFAGIPAGRYPFYCLPHQALQMKGEVMVR